MKRSRLRKGSKPRKQRLKTFHVPYKIYDWDYKKQRWKSIGKDGEFPVVAKSSTEAKVIAQGSLEQFFRKGEYAVKTKAPVVVN